MKSLIAAVFVFGPAIALSGCLQLGMQSEAPIVGCNVYATTLQVLATANRAGKLTLAQIDIVDQWRPTLNALCLAKSPPTGPEVNAVIVQGIAQLVLIKDTAK